MSAEDGRAEIIERYRREIERLERSRDFGAVNRVRMALQRLRACPPSLMGVFDQGIDYHTLWDRCWAAKWIPLQEVFEVAEWHYCQYKEPYTGAPAYVWYIDNEGREVKRPYEG